MEQTRIPSKSSDLILLGATVFAYLTYLKNSELKTHLKKLRKQNKEFRQQQQSAPKEGESACTSITSKLDETYPEDYVMREIGVITSPYPQRAGTPRQGLLAMNSRSILTLHDGISKECFDDLEQYSHVYIIFQFHLNPIGKGKDKNIIRQKGKQKKSSVQFTASKIKPPRANGKKVGVFATRSPHRPNNIGISIAKIEEVTTVSFVGENKKVKKKTVLKLKGLDLVDGTPVYDVKPYLPWDVVPTNELRAPSWVGQDDELSKVEWKEEAKESVQTYQKRGILAPLYPAKKKKDNHKYDEEVIKAITEIVAQDPRSQHEGRGNATLDSSTFEITFCQLRVNFSVGIDKVAYIKKVLLDEGDVTAQPGSYQHSLGMRRKAEAHALKRGIKNLLWKFPVREGVLSDLYLLRDGTTYDFE
ncbi:hypothetical protein CTEN210_09306 [Chaetoceros tenuissimus]|uniref:TsaA-like domain-containing protein n=1 Tax=Chaetoceros tenuissimus TaxID=426638 RepID=A0AAD3CXK4_9STRA|nr:hypothetical protein CTEN210_09306 [Chaetoceros tenuissimus]